MRVLVVGGSGLIGSNVVEVARERGFEVRATYRTTPTDETTVELDKTDAERTTEVVASVDPDVVVDTAAYHNVDACETRRDLAWRVNAAGTYNVACAAEATDAHLVYLSTDYVFGGDPGEAPFVESDPVSPVNYYAETKYAGERAARVASDATVLRTSVVYGWGGENFATWALGELDDGETIRIVDDQTSAPAYARDVARACVEVAAERLTGTYHAAGPDSLSRYELTTVLAETFGHDPERVVPISTPELGQEAPRPTDSTLDSSRLSGSLGLDFLSPAEGFPEMRRTRE